MLGSQTDYEQNNGNIWIAGNGIIIYEHSDGTLSCNAYGPEAEAALNEYIDSHDW